MDERTTESIIPEILVSDTRTRTGSTERIVQDALRAIRVHLDMDVAFVSEFTKGRRVFRYVDAGGDDSPIAVGGSDPLDESYCQRVVDGRLPELIRDATQLPAALEIAATLAVPIGAHVSVPLRLSNGQVFGTFCCFSSDPDPSLDERDLSLLRMFSDFTSRQIEEKLVAERLQEETAERVRAVLLDEAYRIVYQPIFDLAQNRIVGFEALTRFTAEPVRTPDVWFQEAADVALGEQLEMAVIKKALAEFVQFPDDCYLSLNASPANVINGALARALHGARLDRVVLEITEHAEIADYSLFAPALAELRDRGLRLAVDDVGAGYASLHHVLQLYPDLIKLDVTLTRNIDKDSRKHALASAFVAFAKDIGGTIIAEGVETDSELKTLRNLNVTRAQGYLLGRPMPAADALKLFET